MTPGILPCAAPPPASLFAPLLRRSAQKVTKKARHWTRCPATHHARRGVPALLAVAGSLRRHSPCAASRSRRSLAAPCGLFLRRLRCSAPRTAPGSTNPCIPALPRRMFRATLGFCGRMPPKPGPPEARRGCAGKVRRRAHTMCARSLNVHRRTSGEPRSTLADLEGRMPGRRAVGGVFLWLPFFAQAKKVTRSPQASGSSALELRAQRRASRVVMNLANPVTDLT
jgi:hypothetical protein